MQGKARFQTLNEAYEALSDPVARAHYDGLGFEAPKQPVRESKLDPIRCLRCNKITAQPRYLIFWQVVSVLALTVRTPIQGIFCASCARRAALRATTVSAFLGWWGVPWGPIYTIGSVVKNAFCGESPPGSEDKLLWYNALAFLSHGNQRLSLGVAKRVTASSNRELADNASRLSKELEATGLKQSSSTLKNPWNAYGISTIGQLGILSFLPALIAVAVLQDTRQGQTTGYSTPPSYVSAPASNLSLATSGKGLSSQVGQLAAGQSTQASIQPPRKCVFVTWNGKFLEGYAKSNAQANRVEIKNGSNGNAIVKLRNAATNKVAVSLYIEKNNFASFDSLPDGRYWVQFETGEDLREDCRRFLHRNSVSQFSDINSMQMSYTKSKIFYDVVTYTLYPVPAGNATTRSISDAEFDAE